MKTSNPTHAAASLSPGKRILLLLLALAFLILAFFLIRGHVLRQEYGIHVEKYPDTTATESGGLSGYYTLRAYTTESMSDDSEDYDEWYLVFHEDGSGLARFAQFGPSPFTYTEDQLCFSDGSFLRYSLDGDTITVYSSAVFVFAKAIPRPLRRSPRKRSVWRILPGAAAWKSVTTAEKEPSRTVRVTCGGS